MSASSLIFVVIFAVWAAYMLQHWVRRREDLATARSVDQFSEAMRMLERRTPVKADLSPRNEEVRPPLLRRRTESSAAAGETQVSVEGATPLSALGRVKKSTTSGVSRVSGNASKFSLTSPEAKLGVLLAAVAFCLLTLVLAPFGVVPAWLPVLGLLAVGGTVMWLRRVAIQNRAVRATNRTSTPSVQEAGSAKVAAAPAARASVVEPVTKGHAASMPGRERDQAAERKRSPLVAERVQVQRDVVFDQEPDMNAVARAEAEVFDAGWNPVEVPRPTYTMKAKAERADITPAATVAHDVRPLAARYENTPVAELPFDGMALDEDYDELPQVYRAG